MASEFDDKFNDHLSAFRKALEYLLDKRGWGAETTLALEVGLSQGYLNKIKKGVLTGSLKSRSKIAQGLGLDYSEMLALGRQLQEGRQDLRIPLQAIRKPAADPAADPNGEVVLKSPLLSIHSDSPDRPPAGDAHIESLINDVRAILTSGDQTAIEELQRCIAHYRSSTALRRRLVEMEARMQTMEQRLQAANNRIRQNDDPTAKDRILKKRKM